MEDEKTQDERTSDKAGMPSSIFDAADILEKQGLQYNSLNAPDMTFEGDKRFAVAIEYATAIGRAIRDKDRNLLPPRVGKDIVVVKEEAQEKILSEAFQDKVLELYGSYDGKTGLVLRNREDRFRKLIGEILNKDKDQLTKKDLLIFFEKMELGEISQEKEKQIMDAYSEESKYLSSVTAYPQINGVEHTKLVGKDSENPERGLICRHIAPLKAAMWEAAGFKGAKVVTVEGHVTVVTPLGNVDEGTVSDPRAAYRVKIMGGIESLTKGDGGSLLACDSRGKLHFLTNPGLRKITNEEVLNLETFESFLRDNGGEKFYQKEIDTSGPTNLNVNVIKSKYERPSR